MSDSTEQPPAPKIEFPCEDYPIKVLGDSGDHLYQLVIEVMERNAPGFDQTRVTVKDSRKGTFQSVTVWITATGAPQLQTITDELREDPCVKMVM